MPGQFDLSKLFNVSDLSPLDKLIQTIDELDKQYGELAKNGEANSKKFAAALQEVNDQAIKLEKSVQGLDASVKEHQKTIGQAATEAGQLKVAQEQLTKAQETQNAIVIQAKATQDKLSTAKKGLTKATLEEKLAQQEANRVSKLSIKQDQAQEGSVDQLRATVGLLKIEWAKLSKEERENTVAGQKLEKQLSELNQELKDTEQIVGITSRSVGDYANAIAEAAGKINPLKAGTQGFGSALAGIVGSVPQLAALGAVVGGVAVAMDELQELTAEVKIQLKQVSDLTGATGDNLDNLTASIRATSGIFDKEFNEVLRSANVLSKEFGISQDEALGLINEGLIRGADAGGDFLDQISEYSGQFKAAGLDARGLINTIDVSVKEGIFSDKGADLVKEAGLRLREMTQSTKDALKPLGDLTNQQIASAVAAGDTFEAIKLVANGIDNAALSAQEVQTIIADAFGGPGEDAGLRFIELLGDIDQGFTLTEDSATEFQKSQLKLLEVEKELSQAQVAVGEALKSSAGGYKLLGLSIQTFALKFFLALLDIFQPIKEAFGILFDAIGNLIDAFEKLGGEGKETIGFFTIVKDVLTAVLSPVIFFVKIIGFLIDQLTNLISQQKGISGFFDVVTKGFTIWITLIRNIPFLLAGLFEAVKVVFFGLRKAVVDTFGSIQDIIVGALTLNPARLAKGLQNVKKPFSELGSDVADAFNKGFLDARKASIKETEKVQENANDNTLKTQRTFAQKLTAEQIAANKKRAEAIRKATFELNKFRIQQEIKALDEIAANEELILASRLRALNDATDKRIDLAMLERNELLRNEELTAAGRTLILEQFAAQLSDIEKDADAKIKVAIELDTKRTEDELKQLFDTTLTQRISETNAALANELTALNEAFNNEEISLIDFEQRKLDIERQFNEERLTDQLAFFENQLQFLELSKTERLAIEEQIANTRLALAERNNDDLLAREQELQAALSDLKNAAFESALTIIENSNDAEDEKRERDLEKLNEQEENELLLAGDNEERKAEIIERFAAKRQEIEAEQAKADRRRAIFEKGLAALQIGVSTAQAVIKTVAASPLTGGLPFSAIVAAIGAVQLAAVLSKPIPQFWKGTSSAPEGWAMINELGPEMLTLPGGKKTMVNSDGPTMAFLPGGTRVDTADVTERMLNDSKSNNMANMFHEQSDVINYIVEKDDMKDELRDGFSMLNHSIKTQRRPIINVDKNDIKFMSSDGRRLIEYLGRKYPN